jgi:AraC-like DNA-binding protein/mannose-6-phosphate isomerase-like protein (cupin superfamily)
MNEEKGIPNFQSRRFLNKDFPFKIFRYSSQLLKQTMHTHDYVQIAYVHKGMCNHTMLGKSLTVSRGDLFIIKPGTGHSFSAIDAKEFELVLIDFAPDLLDGQFGPLEDTLKSYLTPGPRPAAHSWLHIGKNRQTLVAQLLLEMQDEFESKEIGYEYSIRLTLVKLLMVVEREYRKFLRKPDRQSVAANLQPIEEVRRYIHDNYSQDIPLEHGAYIASMAPAYFSHVFKKVTGQSFIDYVNEVRIEKAMELINRHMLTITQIGFQVGYRHLSHFIRTFKKRTGITPTEYKKTFGSAIQTNKERGKTQ